MRSKQIGPIGSEQEVEGGYVNLIVVPTDSASEPFAESVPLLGMQAAELENMSRKAGAQSVEFFGGYRHQPYEPEKSIDLIMIARK